MQRVTFDIDVAAAIGATTPQKIVATAHLPEPGSPDGEGVVIFAVPGGGYSRHYFDMWFPGHDGYSEAEYHTARGILFIAVDSLCVGDSSGDLADSLTFEQFGDSYDAFVRAAMAGLRAGTLIAGLAPLVDPFVVGIGQSLGGGETMMAQGRRRTFDAIAPLGKSAIHTILPQPTFALFESQKQIFTFARSTPIAEIRPEVSGTLIPDFVYPFHWPEEPQEIQDADMKAGYPIRDPANLPAFASATMPRCAGAAMSPGYFTPEAYRIDVPVLMAFGERDVSADMRREATAFASSHDVSVFIVPRMAHMHNFAPTRRLLWQRVADWAQMQARARRAA